MTIPRLVMRPKVWLVLTLTVFAAIIPLYAPSKALAADTDTTDQAFNLTLSPLPVSLIASPGQTITAPIKIENSGARAIRVKVSVMKFSADGATGQPLLQEPTAQDDYIHWASFSQNSFVAVPGVYNTITMTIKVPKTAAFGYYYAAVFSEDNGAKTPTPRQNKVNGAIASLILLDVQAPGEKRQLHVANFQATHKVYQFLPASFTVQVQNTGNIHVVPTGNIFIGRKASGNFIDALKVNEGQGNVLPGSKRTFTVNWGNGFPNYTEKTQNGVVVADKNGKPTEKLSWNLANANKFRFGRYVASLTLVYNDGKADIPISGEVTFWVIPWIPILVILAVVVLLLVGVFVLLRSLLRRLKGVKSGRHYKT